MKIPFTPYSLKLVKTKVHTVLHPEVKELMEYAFTLTHKGKDHDYYKFKDPTQMPYLRYQQLMRFKDEADQCMTVSERKLLIDLIKDCINNNEGILVTEILKALNIMEYADSMFVDMSIMEKLMTCYFVDMTMNEDVTDYDQEFNNEKAEIFRSQDPGSFFFKKPICELLPLSDVSEDDLKVFLLQTKAKEQLMKGIVEDIRSRNGLGKPDQQEAGKA